MYKIAVVACVLAFWATPSLAQAKKGKKMTQERAAFCTKTTGNADRYSGWSCQRAPGGRSYNDTAASWQCYCLD